MLKTIIPCRIDLESFGNTTYLKIDVNNDDSFNDLIDEFNSTFRDALNHSKVDVDSYLDENVSYYSIYDFNDLNENIAIYNGEGCALTLNIYKNCLELVYNCELFSAEYISHMAKNIESLINNVLDLPNQEISNVDILSDEEKALLCDYCKGKTIEVDENKILSRSFREYAIKNPDNIAVDDGISQISYGELEKSSNSIANDLQKNHEIKPGYRVGLMLPRNYHFPELILALNKIGAAYVPIEPSFPSNRIEHIINTARSEQLITTKDIADDFDVLDNSDDMGSEIINQILNDSNDFVTEFFVQLYQNGDDYSLTISHSNRYSERMINDFKDTYISVI